MSGVQHLVQSGPLILAAPVAAAAGAITFLSPCCLPLVPGYLSYVTGMSGTDAQRTAAAGGQAASVAAAPQYSPGGATPRPPRSPLRAERRRAAAVLTPAP